MKFIKVGVFFLIASFNTVFPATTLSSRFCIQGPVAQMFFDQINNFVMKNQNPSQEAIELFVNNLDAALQETAHQIAQEQKWCTLKKCSLLRFLEIVSLGVMIGLMIKSYPYIQKHKVHKARIKHWMRMLMHDANAQKTRFTAKKRTKNQ